MFLQAIESRGVNFPFHLTVDCKDKMHQRRQQISPSANRKATILGKYVSVCQPWLWKCLSHFLLSADEPETTYDFSKCCQKQTVTAQQPKTPGFNICLWACTDHWNRLRAHQDICGTFSTFILSAWWNSFRLMSYFVNTSSSKCFYDEDMFLRVTLM